MKVKVDKTLAASIALHVLVIGWGLVSFSSKAFESVPVPSPCTTISGHARYTLQCTSRHAPGPSRVRRTLVSATTFAPVPLKTGYASARSPNAAFTTSCSRSVTESSPYEISWPSLAAASAASTPGCTPA